MFLLLERVNLIYEGRDLFENVDPVMEGSE